MNGRIATVMVHTSPLDQPGIGDAGGMNIYVLESAQRMAAMGVIGRYLHTSHRCSMLRRLLKFLQVFEFAILIADTESDQGTTTGTYCRFIKRVFTDSKD